MKLSEIFEYLSYGELSQLAIGSADDGGIQARDYPKVISYVNLAMIEIYKRFSLREKQVLITLDDSITEYILNDDYAVSNVDSVEPIKYITDTISSPFTNDVLMIVRIVDADGDEFPLNSIDDELSLFTPNPTTVSMSYPEDETTMTITYRAYPDKIALTTATPETIEVALPEQLLEALLSYVAHRAYSSMNNSEATEGTTYYSKFLAAIRTVKETGGILKTYTDNSRLDDNGWA